MSPEEFDAIPAEAFDDRYRYELIRGVLIVSPYPSIGERDPNEELGYWLRLYRESDPRGKCIDGTVPEQTVPTTNRRRADRVVWVSLGRVPDPEVDVPAIVIEFVSKSRRDTIRDYLEKRSEYLAAGVREYWVIDRFRRRMTVYAANPAVTTERVVAEGEIYRTELLPGFELPLARLLVVADQWKSKGRSRSNRRGKKTDG
jgi:Uma2 family endonuclease